MRLNDVDPPPLNCSAPIVRYPRVRSDSQTIQTGSDCHKTMEGRGVLRPRDAARRHHAISADNKQTFYRWYNQYGGMATDQLKELKRLQQENDRLRRAESHLTLGKLMSPSRLRACIDHIRNKMRVSERRVCRVLGQHRPTQRRLPVGRAGEDRLATYTIELMRHSGRYWYGHIAALLSDAG